jgi:hypothetical protein
MLLRELEVTFRLGINVEGTDPVTVFFTEIFILNTNFL